jgi:hypothetical protein
VLANVSTSTGTVADPALSATGGALVSTSDLLGGVTDTLPGPLGTTGTMAATALGDVGTTVAGIGTSTSTGAGGLAGAPVVGSVVGSVVDGGDAVLNPLASVSVVNTQLLGSTSPGSSPLLDASVLSGTSATAGAVNVNALTNHQLVAVALPTGTSAGSPVGSVLQPVGAVTSPIASATGGAVSIGSSGAVVPVSTGGGAVGGVVGGTTSAVGTTATRTVGTVGGVLAPVTSGVLKVLGR